MPTGRVRFFDADKGFGFITKDDGGDVYVRANALPTGVTALKAGQRVEFGVIEGRRGDRIPHDLADEALLSLEGANDRAVLTAWIRAYLLLTPPPVEADGSGI